VVAPERIARRVRRLELEIGERERMPGGGGEELNWESSVRTRLVGVREEVVEMELRLLVLDIWWVVGDCEE
jgi:hypothetical protein